MLMYISQNQYFFKFSNTACLIEIDIKNTMI